MATHTLSSGDFIRPYRRVRTETFREGASQSFKIGDPIIRSSVSDYEGSDVIIGGTDPVALIMGFAAEAASGTRGTRITVWMADADAEFVGVEANGASDGTLDGDHVGKEYGLIADGTNSIWRVDYSETTSGKNIRIVKLLDADGDVNGKVVFKVKSVATASQAVYGAA